MIGPDPSRTTRLKCNRVAVTWGASPTITLNQSNITVNSFSNAPCASNTTGRDCVPQPAPALATDDLDNLSNHLMYRLAYRNFGGSPIQESLVANESVGFRDGGSHSAIRWYEFQNAGSSATTPTVASRAHMIPMLIGAGWDRSRWTKITISRSATANRARRSNPPFGSPDALNRCR